MAGTVSRRTLPDRTHEWVSFADPEEDRTWVFDVTFLTSRWRCLFGAGCQGVLTAPAPELEQGCCSYGAHFTDADDRRRVEEAAAELTPEQWQFADRGRTPTGRVSIARKNKAGETVTKMVDGACIFLNRPEFPAGAGCALHQVALATARKPLELKPAVCWQLPLRREDDVAADGHVTSTVRQWDRRHWGAGGAEFHWWCTEAPEAFSGEDSVYRAMRDELVALVGAPVYDLLVTYLESRPPGSFAAHPSTVSSPDGS